MQNVIFGGGIVALLAKYILGNDWKIIPFYRSRFFSFNPALDDNFIIRDETLDDFIKDLTHNQNVATFIYKRAWSIGGELVTIWNKDACSDWLYKIFGNQIPSQTEVYMSNRMNLFVYDIRLNQLYDQLLKANLESLKSEASKGMVSEIGDHYYIRNGIREDFDNAISTIPLDALYNLMSVKNQTLASKTLHYLHIKTSDLDFEGNNQTLVVDRLFSFYKVTNIAPDRYLFYCHEELPNPGVYLMTIMKSFDILDGTSIEHAMPMGDIPKLDWLEKQGIFCVGSFAQWDWCMDVGSCILRTIKYASRGFKPFKKKTI